MSRARRMIGLLGLTLLLSGCGPHIPLEVAVRQVPVDIILGLEAVRKAIAAALPSFTPPPPAPPAVAPPTGPGSVAIPTGEPVAKPTRTPTPTPVPCPAANLLTTFPAKPASADLQGRPAPGSYPFRVNGGYQPDTSTKAGIMAFPADSTRTVSTPQTLAQGIFTFDVVDTAGGKEGLSKVTTSFEVVPQNVTEGSLGGQTVTQAAGIYITAISGQPLEAPYFNFKPQPMITYLNLPVSFGINWDTSGTDPLSGLTLKLHGAIDDSLPGSNKGRRVVDACGTLIDTWEVVVSGTLVGSSENLSIGASYDIATQYGGMTFAEIFAYGGPDSGLSAPSASSKYAATSSVLTPAAR